MRESAAALRPRATNPRTHSKRQIRWIADSIERFGFTNPVLIDRAGGIVAGHGRVEAAKLLGIERVPTIRLDDLTEAEVRAYVIADNRLAELAGWDREILATEFQGLLELDIELDLTITGFEMPEIDIMISIRNGAYPIRMMRCSSRNSAGFNAATPKPNSIRALTMRSALA